MWLFDNLFLDQNTPITINDGVDHSKDVVMEIVDPSAAGGQTGDPSTWANPQDDGKKDDSISDLFASDKKEETEAEGTLAPEAPADVAWEIGNHPTDEIAPLNSIAWTDSNALTSNFDIGWDLSFDNIAESTISTEWEVTDATSSSDITLSGVPIVIDAQNLLSADSQVPNPWIAGSFLGADAPNVAWWAWDQATVKNEETSNQVSPSSTESITPPVPMEWGILDLIWGASPEVPAVAPEPTPAVPNQAIDLWALASTPTIPQTPVVPPQAEVLVQSLDVPAVAIPPQSNTTWTAFTSPISSPEIPMLGRDALALLREWGQTSTLLREKLYSFIEELKTLHSRDQSQRYHKLEQIAMYEERIREIDAEAANRKRVLQAEIDDLKRQIEIMDREKNDIQDVISTFQKEVSHS